MTKFSHITHGEDFVKIKFHNYQGYKPRFLKLCKYQQYRVILRHNIKLIQSELFYFFMHTYVYLEYFKSVFSLNKQIFQLFQLVEQY